LSTVLMGIELLTSHPFINLSNTIDSEDVREILSDMNISCESAIDTLNDLLLFEKIEDGKMKLERKSILISELIARCVKPFDLQVCLLFLDIRLTVCVSLSASLSLCHLPYPNLSGAI
jgi:signal transduction histidine kinase